jgi:hypothetical protein
LGFLLTLKGAFLRGDGSRTLSIYFKPKWRKGGIMPDTANAGENTSTEGAQNPTIEGSEQKTFTQDEVNRLVGKARKEASHKNENYEVYKQAYEELEQIKESNKSELQKAQDRAAKLETQLKTLKHNEEVQVWKREVASAAGVPADVLRGNTREEIEAHAQALQAAFEKPSAPVVGSDGNFNNAQKAKTKSQLFAETLERKGL